MVCQIFLGSKDSGERNECCIAVIQETMKGRLSMGQLLILFAIFACFVGFDANLSGSLALASDAGREGIAKDSSSGIGSNPSTGDSRLKDLSQYHSNYPW